MKKHNWFRLDNSAMIYPMVITLGSQSLFQLGASLQFTVNKNILKNALDTALCRYPYYKVELKYGFFRHYLEENPRPTIVYEYDGNLLQLINFRKNNHFLFRLSYYENKIFLDLFHGLCDANGGIEFLKTIIYYYYKLLNVTIPSDNVITIDTPISKGETEDAFLKNFRPFNFKSGLNKMAGGSAYKLPGKQFRYGGLGLIQGEVNTKKLLDIAHKYNCTITVFLSALALFCAASTNKNSQNKSNYVAFIPINLRKFYPSNTMSNFTIFAKCIVPYNTPYKLENYIEIVKNALIMQLSADEISTKLSFTSLMDKLKILRYMPLLLKAIISKLGRNFPGKSKQTIIVSNIGIVNFDKTGNNVNKFMFALNCNKKSPKNLGILSYKDTTVISFSRKVINSKLEKEFFSTLSSLGIDVCVSSNFREECNVL